MHFRSMIYVIEQNIQVSSSHVHNRLYFDKKKFYSKNPLEKHEGNM